MSQDDLYYYVRLGSWWLNFGSFMILCYKFIYNNFTGKKHAVNWGAVGLWIATFSYAVGVGEILYTHSHVGGIRVYVSSVAVVLWFWIALFKIPLAKEWDRSQFGIED